MKSDQVLFPFKNISRRQVRFDRSDVEAARDQLFQSMGLFTGYVRRAYIWMRLSNSYLDI